VSLLLRELLALVVWMLTEWRQRLGLELRVPLQCMLVLVLRQQLQLLLLLSVQQLVQATSRVVVAGDVVLMVCKRSTQIVIQVLQLESWWWMQRQPIWLWC
jgi:hypothetical protein